MPPTPRLLLALLLVPAACDRGEPSPAKPATAPAAAATPSPTPFSLRIHASDYPFPPARLLIVRRNGSLVARLYSQPPATTAPVDGQHRLYFEFPLEADTADNLAAENFVQQFATPAAEVGELRDGIFLFDSTAALQAKSIQLTFDNVTPTSANATLAGEFFVIGDLGDAPETVTLRATFPVLIVVKQP